MLKIIDIKKTDKGSVTINLEMGEWYKIYPFGRDFLISHSDNIKKDVKIRSLAHDYINGEEVKDLLIKYRDTKFPLSLYCYLNY